MPRSSAPRGTAGFRTAPDATPAFCGTFDTASSSDTRSGGLIWLEDVHYNGDKFNTQQSDTFSWDNVAFGGPLLPRDLGFDVLDNTTPGRSAAENGQPTQELGYHVNGASALTLSVPGVRDITSASGALLTVNDWAQTPLTITCAVNGNPAMEFARPFGNTAAYASTPPPCPPRRPRRRPPGRFPSSHRPRPPRPRHTSCAPGTARSATWRTTERSAG